MPSPDERGPVSRIFLGWDEPALPLAAAALCDHYAADALARDPTPDGGPTGPDVLRLDRALVALPGARAGRRLKELLVVESDRRGVPLVPPRVTTMGAVPELLYEPGRPTASSAVARRVWAEALQTLDRDTLGAIFSRLPDADALPDWARLGRELHVLHRQVAAGGLRFHDVAERCCDSPLYDDAARWRVLARVQSAYEARLETLRLADLDLARLDAVDAGRAGTDLDLWVVGVAEMPGVVRRVVSAAAEKAAAEGREARALVHAPESRADAFDALGCVVPEQWLEAEIPLEEDRLAVVDRPDDQAETVARALQSLDGEYAADEVVVGVPERDLVPYLEQRLEAGGVPAREAAGTRVSRTGPYRLLSAVADYLDGRRFDTLAALARHPDLGRWLTDAGSEEPALRRPDGWLGPLDRWFNEHLPARVPQRRSSVRAAAEEDASAEASAAIGEGATRRGRRARDRAAVAALLQRLDLLLADLTQSKPAPVSQWAERSLELLETVYGGRELKPDVPAHRRLIRALDRMGKAALSLIELPPELDAECGASEALRLVLDEAAGESVPPAAERSAVELLGWLELHLDDAPVAMVTGVNEPYVPESVSAHAFLPDGMRTLLGLEDNDRRYARDAYQLTAMLHSRPQLRLISGRRTASGDPLRPSRLLFAADPETVARRVRVFYDDEYEPSPPPETEEGAATRQEELAAPSATGDQPPPSTSHRPPSTRFTLPPEPVISAHEPLTQLRATDFKPLLSDPYAWALDRIVGLEILDDADREMDPLRFGSLAHRVLERFGKDRDVVNTADADAIRRRLNELLEEAVDVRFGRNAHVAVEIQVDQLRTRLHAFADWHAGWIGKGWEVIAAECSTPDSGVPLDVDGVPFGISARIDRVDYHADTGEWAVFDYKTGDAGKSPDDTHRTNYGKDWADLQLPLYHWLLPQITDYDGAHIAPDAETIRVGYILLARDLDQCGHSMAQWGADMLEDALDEVRRLVRFVRENRFEHDPATKPRNADSPLEALLGIGQFAAGRGGGAAVGAAEASS